MPLLQGNIAIDPSIKGNLRGLAGLSVEVQVELSQVPTLLSQVNPVELQDRATARLSQAGFTVNPEEPAVLVLSLAAAVRHVPAMGGVVAIFAIDTTLRELVSLPRAGEKSEDAGTGSLVDTWRRKESTGYLSPRMPVSQAAGLLIGECNRHIEEFIAAWISDEPAGTPRRKAKEKPPKRAPDTPDPKFAKIRAELERLLGTLAQGNEGRATIEKFEVNGTQVSFKAKVRHHHVLSKWGFKTDVYSLTTTAEGNFDAANPASLDIDVCVKMPSELGGGKQCIQLGGLKGLLA